MNLNLQSEPKSLESLRYKVANLKEAHKEYTITITSLELNISTGILEKLFY